MTLEFLCTILDLLSGCWETICSLLETIHGRLHRIPFYTVTRLKFQKLYPQQIFRRNFFKWRKLSLNG